MDQMYVLARADRGVLWRAGVAATLGCLETEGRIKPVLLVFFLILKKMVNILLSRAEKQNFRLAMD